MHLNVQKRNVIEAMSKKALYDRGGWFHHPCMVKESALFNDAHWFRLKRHIGFEQHSSIEINKVKTLSQRPPFNFPAGRSF